MDWAIATSDRNGNKSLNSMIVDDTNWVIEQAKENARLREALKAIASEDGVSEGYQYADQVTNNLISIAKSALEETK